ncbi:MAG: primase-helicase family protein [Novosphingobium meiothermophilum]|uniref:primase-helicase family protein n=1 Tax=Novosphingobium TaxID=165696 RepID=UPI000D6DF034|nr:MULTISPECIES: primase-helicase family protein [Novosphingobium]
MPEDSNSQPERPAINNGAPPSANPYAWQTELHPAIQTRLLHGPSDPVWLVRQIAHLSPAELRWALTEGDLPGLALNVPMDNREAVEAEVTRLTRIAAWHRETWTHGQVPEELNHHAFVRHYGNKPVVIHWARDGQMVIQSPEAFRTSNMDRYMAVLDPKTGELKRVPLAPAWLLDPGTPRFDRAEFLPGVTDVPTDTLNLWRGWPVRDDVTDDSPGEPPECALFLAHLRDNVCGGDHRVFWYLLGWMADALQNPHRTCEVALVLRGPQGSGKTIFAKLFMEFFAPHTLTLDKPDHLTGSFNRHLQDKCVVFADEAFFAGNRQHAATLKTLITDDEIFIHPKGVDGFMAKKLFRLIIASNDEHVVRADVDDRRYLVLNVDAGPNNQNGEYFGDIVDEWRNGGKIALFRWLRGAHWCKMLETGVWDVRDRPKTAALQEQKNLSLPRPQLVVHNMLRDGDVPGLHATDDARGFVFVSTRALQEASRLGTEHEKALGDALRVLAGKGAKSCRIKLGEGAARRDYRGFWLPPLDECRRRWEASLCREVEWPADVATWGLETRQRDPGDGVPF